MNPAALKRNIGDLKLGGMLIVNTDKFTDRDLVKAEYANNPLEDESLNDYQVVKVPLKLTQQRCCQTVRVVHQRVRSL